MPGIRPSIDSTAIAHLGILCYMFPIQHNPTFPLMFFVYQKYQSFTLLVRVGKNTKRQSRQLAPEMTQQTGRKKGRGNVYANRTVLSPFKQHVHREQIPTTSSSPSFPPTSIPQHKTTKTPSPNAGIPIPNPLSTHPTHHQPHQRPQNPYLETWKKNIRLPRPPTTNPK